jgi:hypothetical protein
MNDDKLPYPDDDDDTIAPDVAPRKDQPISPAEAVRLEREKYGESGTNENRDDQADVHHGQPEDIV